MVYGREFRLWYLWFMHVQAHEAMHNGFALCVACVTTLNTLFQLEATGY